MQVGANITADYKFYILLCGIFSPERNILKHWDAYEDIFIKLVAEVGGKKGRSRIWQAILLYFGFKYTDKQKFFPTFTNKLYQGNFFSEDFIKGWYATEIKLDKTSSLKNLKNEKAMRPLLDEFIAHIEQEEESGEEEEEEASGDEQPAPVQEESKVEDEATRQQRELIEAQKRA